MLNNKVHLFARYITSLNSRNTRTFKNFGHKRQPIPGITVAWHAFLTFTFIGLWVEWKRIAKFMLGDDEVKISFDPTDTVRKE